MIVTASRPGHPATRSRLNADARSAGFLQPMASVTREDREAMHGTEGVRGVAHGALRLRQVHHRPRAGAAARSRPGRLAYVLDGDNLRHGLCSRPRLLPGGPRGEHPAGRRGRGAVGRRRAHRDRRLHLPLPGRIGSGRARSCPWAGSSRSIWTCRSRCARGETRRGSTAGLGPGRSPAFTGIDAPYEAPRVSGARVSYPPDDSGGGRKEARGAAPGREGSSITAPFSALPGWRSHARNDTPINHFTVALTAPQSR